MKIRIKRVLLIIFLLILSYGIYYGIQAGKIATSYVAKIACSCTMVSKRPIEDVYKTDLSKYSFVNVEVDKSEQSVTASALGIFKRKAIFRQGLGCTLVTGIEEDELRSQVGSASAILPPIDSKQKLWPMGDSLSVAHLPENVDSIQLSLAIDKAFAGADQEETIRSRGVIVVYRGKIIAEKYAKGITIETPLLGWSMTKSVTNALLGILVKDNKIDIKQKAPIKEWAQEERSSITLDQLLRMSSGLEFQEVYDVVSDATKMLFNSKSSFAVAVKQPLANAPESTWSYSSGTTNILSQIIKDKITGNSVDSKHLIEYFNFPRIALFNKIGMNSAVMEPDPSGTFVGSSFMYATARDWARFGLLYLNDGIWEGNRILPEGWVKYSSTKTPKAPLGQYGAHWWLNAGEDEKGNNRKWPALPTDLFHAAGFEGQNVVVIPSYEMVIVRLGNTQKRESWDIGVLVEDVLKSIK